ncbi:MAG: ATP-binding protein [Beutenbergiaceae bacterium]
MVVTTSDSASPAAQPANRRAELAFDACPDGILVIDADTNILAANRAIERILGYRVSEVIGTNAGSLIDRSESLREAATQTEQRWRGSSEPVDLGLQTFTRADDSAVHVNVSIVRTQAGEHPEFTVFLVDVTELERERAHNFAVADYYRAISKHSVGALILHANNPKDSLIVSSGAALGYPALTPLPGGLPSLTHPQDGIGVTDFLQAIDARGAASAEVRLRAADGRWLTCELIAENRSDDPTLAGATIWAVDVTAQRARQRRVETNLVRLRLLIDNLGAAVLMEDQSRHVLVINDEFASMFDSPVPAEEIVGTDCAGAAESVKDMFADPDGFTSGVSQRVTEQVPVLGERLELANGEVLERDYLPITGESGPAGHIWRYRNVTRQIQETLLLADQNRSLAELSRLKTEFVARVSHELRSPLTSVVSFAELLADSPAEQLGSEQAAHLEIIVRNSRRLLRLIEDLLLVAKLESRTLPLTLEAVDIPTVVHQVVDELRPRAHAKAIELEVAIESGPHIQADALRLQQVMVNLLGNAIGYTPEGGSVTVTARPERQQPEWVVKVIDTGVGIPSEDLPKLFIPFFRSGSGHSQRAGGTGLGLPIVRLIVEQHGGTITAESTSGFGTTVTVRLPFEEA